MNEGTITTISPALDHIIERPRLTDLLDESGARVVVLVAPPGYGKTTLARQWACRQSEPVAWHRTTRASGDVAAFATALDTVLASAAPTPPGDRKRVAAIAAVNARPEPLARAIVSIHRGLPRETLLVVDEYETAGTEEADALLGYLIDELDIRFLVTSRTRPPWFTPRLTVYGEGLEVGVDELTMTDDEAREVLTWKATPEDEHGLLQVARGWPAVLGLAAMTGKPSLPRDELLPRALYDYLATELLDAAPIEVQEGLLLLAAASVGNVEVARLVLGCQAQTILEEAVLRGLLLRIDHETFSVHPLLQEVLVTRMREADASASQRIVASLSVLITGRRWDEALAFAGLLPEPAFVSRALREGLDELLRTGRAATLGHWASIGRTVGADRGLVDYARAEVAFRRAEFDRAFQLGTAAAATLNGDLRARAHLVAARAASVADRLEHSRPHVQAAEVLAQAPETRAAVLWAKFTQAVDDEQPNAADLLDDLESAAVGTADQKIRTAGGKVCLGLLDGRLEARLEEGEIALPLLEHDADPLVRSSFLNKYSDTLSAAARYEEALEAAQQEDEIAEEYELEFVRVHAAINKARALVGLRRFALAGRTLSEAQRRLRSYPDAYADAHCSIRTATRYLSIGDLERAHSTLLLDPDRRLGPTIRGEYIAHRALVLAGMHRTRDARENAELARDTSRTLEVRALTDAAEGINALVEKAPAKAAAALERVIESRILTAVVLAYRACPTYASHMVSVRKHRRLLIALLISSNDSAVARQIGVTIPRSPRRSARLSPRELEIHELIAQGMTNQEISRLLFISESTTKVHVRHILEKLGVRSRVEAAQIASE